MVRRLFSSVIDAVMPSGTGVKSFVAACALRVSKSRPPIDSSFRPWSFETHPWMATRSMFLSGATRSNCSPVQLPCTTSNGYPAGPVSWMMNAAAAPFCEAMSYLYVHRP
jgi:hypothetical protein